MAGRLALLLLTLVVAAGVAGCGSKSEVSASYKARWATDRAFAAEMAVHHRAGIALADLARERGGSALVKRVADDLRRVQETELVALLREDAALAAERVRRGRLGITTRMAGERADPGALRAADPFDAAFLRMMIAHLERGIAIARYESAVGRQVNLRTLARGMIREHHQQIAAMRAAL